MRASRMSLELTYPELALHPRPLAGVRFPDPSLEDTYEPGTTEPWIAQLVCSLLVAHGGSRVLETGGFVGTTSAWLALTLSSMGGGDLTVCEIDHDRVHAIGKRLASISAPGVRYGIAPCDVLETLALYENETFDFVWLDDDHRMEHVAREIEALWPKMKSGGLIVLHDVFGSCDLQRVVKHYGGYSIDLPRLGPAGGIGVIQVV